MENPNQYINNMTDGATAGYRYFDLQTAKAISIFVRGSATGAVTVRKEKDGPEIARIPVASSREWNTYTAPLDYEPGVAALYFTYTGPGFLDFNSFTFD